MVLQSSSRILGKYTPYKREGLFKFTLYLAGYDSSSVAHFVLAINWEIGLRQNKQPSLETQLFARLLVGFAQVEGLPKSALELAAQQAKTEGEADATAEKGPWLFTLDFPSFFPVITHSKNR